MKQTRMNTKAPVRRLPQRTCVACRTVRNKRELIRLVRTAAGTVEIDPGGKKPGRGVYLCPSSTCWQAGLRGKLEYALKITLSGESRERLARYGEGLDESKGVGCGRDKQIE